MLWPRRRFLRLLGAAAIAPALGAARGFASPEVSLNSVLILGDSMALCGFGPRLDGLFRSAGVPSVNTYMACGTQPLSWTMLKSYANAQSRCGFWSIETGPSGPVSMQDTYGMQRGHRPSSYPVPKIEDLLLKCRPDIVVVQLGNNLFDLLKGRDKSRKAAVLEPFIMPFLTRIAEAVPAVRRLYWVAPPTCGVISMQAQDLLVEKLRNCAGPTMRVIDSRRLIDYPYRHLQPDKQHFFGEDMRLWADGVYEIISNDLADDPLSRGKGLLVSSGVKPEEREINAGDATLIVQCSLEKIGTPFRHEEIAPYNESLVAFVYRVHRVLKGTFTGSQLVVLHLAHVAGKRQSMNGFHLGQRRILRLLPVDQTPWATLKARDDPRFLELDRFILEADHSKLAMHL